MTVDVFSKLELAQTELVAALDSISADEILKCSENLERAAAEVKQLDIVDKDAGLRDTLERLDQLSLAARYRIRFLHDVCHARLSMIASDNDMGRINTYSRM